MSRSLAAILEDVASSQDPAAQLDEFGELDTPTRRMRIILPPEALRPDDEEITVPNVAPQLATPLPPPPDLAPLPPPRRVPPPLPPRLPPPLPPRPLPPVEVVPIAELPDVVPESMVRRTASPPAVARAAREVRAIEEIGLRRRARASGRKLTVFVVAAIWLLALGLLGTLVSLAWKA